MTKNKIISLILTFSLLFVTLAANCQVSAVTYPIYAEIKHSQGKGQTTIYSLPGTKGHEIPENKGQSESKGPLVDGTVIKVLGEELDGDGDKWYKINYGDNFGNEGYAYSLHVVLKYDYQHDEAFELELQNFPESYRGCLRHLHAKYPNWKFVAKEIDMDFNTAIDLQYSPNDVTKRKKMVELYYGGEEWRDIRSYNTQTGMWEGKYEGWTYASRAAVAYFVDPRNYFDEKHIFAFLEQSYNESQQNKEGLRTVVANTFLATGYDKDGDGVVDTDAYLDDIIEAAKASGVSPYVLAAAIIIEVGINGGSVTSGQYPGYVGYYNFYNWNATGSDVIGNALAFAQTNGWNSRNAAIVGGAKMYADGYVSVGQDTYYFKNFNYVTQQSVAHQYAESVYGSFVDAVRLSKAFVDNTSGNATFKIPVFKNMPATASPTPSVVETPSVPIRKKCDFNGDDNVDEIDMSIVRLHVLEVNSISNDLTLACDINGDAKIDEIEFAAIRLHILEINPIS